MFESVKTYLNQRLAEIDQISDERKSTLDKAVFWLKKANSTRARSEILFVCIHNSRRSHMAEIHGTAAAALFGWDKKIKVYSGGTTVSAFNPRAAAAMERAGYQVTGSEGKNTAYEIRYSDTHPALKVWSKKFDDPSNPDAGFLAFMTCGQAEEKCPFIPSANARLSVTYSDPSEADDTPKEAETYDDRSREIARDLMYVFSKV